MKRYAINRLQEWKEDPYRLPMIIRGARQVGKTWLMQEFGRTAFEQCAYINFDRNERMQNLLSGDFDVDRILRGLAIERIVCSPLLRAFSRISSTSEYSWTAAHAATPW